VKILVTGGAGFIGSHVVDKYIDRGHDVVVVDNLSTGRLSNLNPAAKFYQADIRDAGLKNIFEEEKPEIVNHHAAQMDVRRSVADPLFDADNNIMGSVNLLECARFFGVKRFIYISSGGAVYGEPKYLPCDESHPISPLCPYGASKHIVEHYLFMYSQIYGLEYIVLRYPNVYGPRQDPRGEAGVIAIFTGKMLANDQPTINGDGEQQRDFAHVLDCAEANIQALETDNVNTIYNIGSGRGTSINEIYDLLKEFTAFQKTAYHGPAKAGETRRIYLDATRARERLGWKPKISLWGGLDQTVSYFRTAELVK
jgi:UDP-glucose 4-epimerase